MVVSLAIGAKQPVRHVDDGGDVADVAHWCEGRKAAQEARFGFEDVADAGQIALVE